MIIYASFGLIRFITLCMTWFDFLDKIMHLLVWFPRLHYALLGMISMKTYASLGVIILITLCIVWYNFLDNIKHRFVLIFMVTLCIVWYDFHDNIVYRLGFFP